MLPLGTYEIIVIVVVALAIIGPKDLPGALKTVFRVVRKAQAVTREFRKGLEDLTKDSGLDEVKRELKAATSIAKGDLGGLTSNILGEDPLDNNSLKNQISPGKDPAGGNTIGQTVSAALTPKDPPRTTPETESAGPAKADAEG